MASTLGESLVWLCIGIQLYHYAGYPLVLWLLGRFMPAPVGSAPITPSVSLIIAAYNEATDIADKLRNSLALDYESLEIIVNSEGSEDETPDIAARFGPRVTLMHAPQRRGKGAAMNAAAARASGEILVFSDANAEYQSDAVRHLVMPFADPSVGCVSGRKIVAGATTVGVGEGLYWKYEAWVRRLEGQLGSVAGVNGEMLAVRRKDFTPIPSTVVNDDVFLALSTIARGRRVVFEPDAVCVEGPSASIRDESVRRARMIAGRYHLFFSMGLLPWARPLELFMLISHKLLRLLLPVFMLIGLAANVAAVILAPEARVLVALLIGQLTLYGLALMGASADRLGLRWRPAQAAWYFVAGHLGSLAGMLVFLRGRQSPLWERVRRERAQAGPDAAGAPADEAHGS
jgi:biofilm PGA synthesis N-glycosyltransferase PgaC